MNTRNNKVFETLLTRRSIRKYTSHDITAEQIEILLKAAMYAPSACDKQPWHFIVFRNPDTKEAIIEVHPHAKMLRQAPVAILICWDENLQHDVGYGQIDCSAATQNILLAAHSIGLGTCWIGIHPRQNRKDALKKIFNLPNHVIPFAVVSVGYPAINIKFPSRFKKNRIRHEAW